MKKDYLISNNKKIIFSVIIVISFTLSILFFAAGCSNSNDDNSAGTINEITGSVDETGGTFEAGQIMIDFPAGSVSTEVFITGTSAFPDELPEYLTPLSSVYEIRLSDSGVYSSDSAILTFNLKENMEGEDVSIYHSSDGVTWDKLESLVEKNTISASIPNFSYFIVAKINPGSGGSTDPLYSLKVINQSFNSGNACLYQNDNQWSASRIYPVAWKSRNISPGSTLTYQWRKNYAFCWARTGILQPGISFISSQIINGDLTSNNRITLTSDSGSYFFKNLTSGGTPGSMKIDQDVTIPFNDAAIGLAMEGSAFCAAQAVPNQWTSFSPADTKYYITMGTYQLGEVMDISRIENEAEIIFPEGVYSMTATCNADGSWTITPE